MSTVFNRQIALAILILSTTLTGCGTTVHDSAAVSKHELVNLRGLIDPKTDFVLESNDGQQVKANVLTAFRLDNKAYALVKQHDRDTAQPPSLMELVADQKQASFRMIKDKAEFERVLEVVQTHPEIYSH